MPDMSIVPAQNSCHRQFKLTNVQMHDSGIRPASKRKTSVTCPNFEARRHQAKFTSMSLPMLHMTIWLKADEPLKTVFLTRELPTVIQQLCVAEKYLRCKNLSKTLDEGYIASVQKTCDLFQFFSTRQHNTAFPRQRTLYQHPSWPLMIKVEDFLRKWVLFSVSGYFNSQTPFNSFHAKLDNARNNEILY